MSEQCVKGVNWGEVTLDDKNLTLRHNKQNLLKIPMKKIVNSITQKNDIVIQLNTEENEQKYTPLKYNSDDMLCEIRFYVPPTSTEKTETKKKSEGENAIQEESEEDNNTNFQQQLHNEILNKAKIGQSSADSIVSISDVPLIVPRGKYNVDLFRYSVRFHGSTYQFTTEYKSISRMFMLPMQDEVHMAFVIGLDKPLK
jgi:structure-specific recognition protein 1